MQSTEQWWLRRASIAGYSDSAKANSDLFYHLYSIAKRVYGDASKWRLIYDANRDQLSNPDAVRVGMKLVVPAAN